MSSAQIVPSSHFFLLKDALFSVVDPPPAETGIGDVVRPCLSIEAATIEKNSVTERGKLAEAPQEKRAP
jgi:hypothetical protein